MTDRKKPGVGFWVTVGLAIVLAYPLSFGPACWISSRFGDGRFVSAIYQPIFRWWWNDDPANWGDRLHHYMRFGANPDWNVVIEARSGYYRWDYWPAQ